MTLKMVTHFKVLMILINGPTIADFQANNDTAKRCIQVRGYFGPMSVMRVDIRVGYGYPTWTNFTGFVDYVRY
jgi:hypothetical protein